MSASADRLLSARLLLRISGGAYASRLLAAGVAAGVRTRVLGVLRWQRSLDAALAPHCSRPLDRLDPELLSALRIGLFEAALMGVPPPLATDGAVHLVRRLGRSSAAGMVNAVLRRAVPAWPEVVEGASPDLRLSHPEWLFGRWAALLGGDAAERAMESAQQPAPVWAWFLAEESPTRLRDEGVLLRSHPWCPGAWSAPDHPRRLVAEASAGRAYIQDPSSQLVALVGCSIVTGGRFVELAAAPGGKAALAVRTGSWRQAVALDLRLGRVRLMSELLDRVAGCQSAVADAAQPPLPAGSWDLVLLDAPCSGTGTLRRHPELKWRLEPQRIDELASLQSRLLEAALPLVAGDGILLYSTCSLEPEENEALFHELPEGFERVELEAALPEGVPWIPTDAGGVRIIPNADGDGFTMHALSRVTK